MELSPYVEGLQAQLAAISGAAGADTRQAAEALSVALEPALRLTLIELLAAATEDLTAGLPDGLSVDLRVRGGEPELVVGAEPESAAASTPATGDAARMTLRLPESLKSRLEQAAAGEGVSVNTWLVRALTRALDTPQRHGGRRITGFARG
ncbi:MAG: toxin-antitoxin system HicB family antitoxin [Actinomycetota bacterium]|nr:toxin-antitoxin system HicB family antitoxin [Actinomycetota bacterium]